MTDKLLPCPFCGGDAFTNGSEEDGFYASCHDCYTCVGEAYDRSAMPEHMFRTETDAIAAWNRRSPDANSRARGPWLPIAQADRSIATVQTFAETSIVLRNSHPAWVRDEDGRVFEAVWSEGTANYWWDLEGESPVDPVEFMPHPLDPRYAPEGGAA